MHKKGMSSIFKIIIGMVLVAIVIIALGAIVNDQTGFLTEVGSEGANFSAS